MIYWFPINSQNQRKDAAHPATKCHEIVRRTFGDLE